MTHIARLSVRVCTVRIRILDCETCVHVVHMRRERESLNDIRRGSSRRSSKMEEQKEAESSVVRRGTKCPTHDVNVMWRLAFTFFHSLFTISFASKATSGVRSEGEIEILKHDDV